MSKRRFKGELAKLAMIRIRDRSTRDNLVDAIVAEARRQPGVVVLCVVDQGSEGHRIDVEFGTQRASIGIAKSNDSSAGNRFDIGIMAEPIGRNFSLVVLLCKIFEDTGFEIVDFEYIEYLKQAIADATADQRPDQ